MSQIEPRTLKGFRDFLPEQQIARQKFMDIIRASYETFGFEPLETPVLEYADILTGKYGDEGDKLMYRFKDNGDRDVAMRYDLTIPLARVMAQYSNDIKRPFKRYQISPVWRADNTQKGRYREFYQCDADIVGTTSPLADAEILALAANTLRRLGVEGFYIRINSREILTAFYESVKIAPEDQVRALRILDKADKISAEEVAKALDDLKIPGIDTKTLMEFSATRISDKEGFAAAAAKYPALKDPIDRLAAIVEFARTLDPKLEWMVDFSIVRGLDYYTGMIFETSLKAAPQFGSVLSGGRYDGLIGTFAKQSIPAVGASIGLDRLMAALEELKLINGEKATAQALIVNFDETLTADYLKLATSLRDAGIKTTLAYDASDLKKQLSYAGDKGIRYALIYGSDEAKDGVVMVKDLEKGTQEKLSLKDIAKHFAK